jgi:hypothetical protein
MRRHHFVEQQRREGEAMSVHWNHSAVENVAREAMQAVAGEERRRLWTVTCPFHGTMHDVVWATRGKDIDVNIEDGCCDELEEVVYAEVEKAIR